MGVGRKVCLAQRKHFGAEEVVLFIMCAGEAKLDEGKQTATNSCPRHIDLRTDLGDGQLSIALGESLHDRKTAGERHNEITISYELLHQLGNVVASREGVGEIVDEFLLLHGKTSRGVPENDFTLLCALRTSVSFGVDTVSLGLLQSHSDWEERN
jgi:hypothetical protein